MSYYNKVTTPDGWDYFYDKRTHILFGKGLKKKLYFKTEKQWKAVSRYVRNYFHENDSYMMEASSCSSSEIIDGTRVYFIKIAIWVHTIETNDGLIL